jgi:hypothetical protein
VPRSIETDGFTASIHPPDVPKVGLSLALVQLDPSVISEMEYEASDTASAMRSSMSTWPSPLM